MHKPRICTLRSLGLTGLLTVASAVPALSAPPDDGGAPPGVGPVASASVVELLRTYGSADRHGKQTLRDRLVDLGPHIVPSVVAVFAGRVEEAAGPGDGPLLDDEREALLYDLLRAWPRDRVVEKLVETLGTGTPDIYDAMLVTRLIGEIGDSRALGEVIDLLARIDPVHLRRPYVMSTSVAAIRGLLGRDEFAYAVLAGRLHKVDDVLLPQLARALGDLGDLEAVPLLEKLLGRTEELDLLVLDALGRPSIQAAVLGEGSHARAVRPSLASTSQRVRRQAAVSLGRLHDAPSASDLVDMLEDLDPGVRRAALEALQALAGTRWDSGPERWTDWLTSERTWLEERAGELAEQARSTEGGDAVAAIRELSSHRLYRDEVSALLAPGLRSSDDNIATATCLALMRIGAPRAVPDLVEALADPREPVRLAANQALARLTGLSLAARPHPWREWLGV